MPAYILANFPAGQFFEDGGLVLFAGQNLGAFDANGLDSGTISITVMDATPVLFE